jgi:acyl dehydratase
MTDETASLFANNTNILEEDIAEARAMIGEPLRINQWNREANIDNICHYSHGLGDDNPLFCDETYAAAGPYGGIVAPPTFFFAIWAAGIGPGFPGLQSFYAGAKWEIERYARPRDRIVVEARLIDVKEVEGRRSGKMLILTGEVLYKTAEGELLARHESRQFRLPRKGVSEGAGLKYQARNPTWTEAQLDEMEAEICAQTRQGSTPLYFEDVSVGDVVPSRLKGPLTMSTLITYSAGCLPSSQLAADIAVKHRRLCLDHPERAPNHRSPLAQAERTAFGQGHYDGKVAAAVGMPGVYDNGWMRVGWAQHFITDWAGDHGVVREMETSIHLPNIIGDIVRFTGEVSAKRIEKGEHIVDIVYLGKRQDGELSCKGTASVRLPSPRLRNKAWQ